MESHLSAPPSCSVCRRPLAGTTSQDGVCLACLLALAVDQSGAAGSSLGSGIGDPVPVPGARGLAPAPARALPEPGAPAGTGAAAPAPTFQHYAVLTRPDGRPWELGRGAMGVTYKALDTNLRCPVALKVINAHLLHHETIRARFVREARAAASLRHPNVASVHHLGQGDDLFFYAMEFVEGETLEERVRRRGPADWRLALGVGRQVARALAAAGRAGLIHRDVKPSNVMVTPEEAGGDCSDEDEEGPLVKLIDFGLARSCLANVDSLGVLTLSGFVGTPQYASPEQLEERELDTRSDIYSLGVTLWFLLAGRPPFLGSVLQLYEQHRLSPLPWEQLRGRDLPASARDLLAAMLAKAPADRPQTADALRREIGRCLRPVPTPTPAPARVTAPAPAPAPVPTPARPAPRPAEPAGRPPASFLQPAAGLLLQGTYLLEERVGVDADGAPLFRARDRGRFPPRTVAVRFGAARIDPAAFQLAAHRVERVRATPHPHLLALLGLGRHAEVPYLVWEWLDGFTLEELRRARGPLPPAEALRLLAPVAAATDHACRHRLPALSLGLEAVWVHFSGPELSPSSPPDRPGARHLAEPLDRWPPHRLKVEVTGLIDPADGPDLTYGGTPAAAGRRLVTTGRPRPPAGEEGVPGRPGGLDGVTALAQLASELLGGPAPAGLGDQARRLLLRTLAGQGPFVHAEDFTRALAAAVQADGPVAPGPALPRPFPAPAASTLGSGNLAVSLPTTTTGRGADRESGVDGGAAAGRAGADTLTPGLLPAPEPTPRPASETWAANLAMGGSVADPSHPASRASGPGPGPGPRPPTVGLRPAAWAWLAAGAAALLLAAAGLGALGEGSRPRPTPSPPPRVVLVPLTLTSNPDAADVFRGAERLGRTTLEVRLPPGSYALTLRRSGWPPAERRVVLSAGPGPVSVPGTAPAAFREHVRFPQGRLRVTLAGPRPLPAPAPASASPPRPPRVLVDDQDAGPAPTKILVLPAGSHRVTLQPAEGPPQTRTVRVDDTDQKVTVVAFDLPDPAPPAPTPSPSPSPSRSAGRTGDEGWSQPPRFRAPPPPPPADNPGWP